MKIIKTLPLTFLLYITAVFANPFTDILQQISFIGLYEAAPHFWDSILFILFFGLISVQFLKKRLGRKGSAVFGIILGLSLGIYMYRIPKTIGDFGAIAASAFILILAVLLFKMVTSLFDSKPEDRWGKLAMFTVAYVLLYAIFISSFPQYFNWLANGPAATKTLYGFLHGLWGLGILYIIIYLFMWLGGSLSGSGSSSGGAGSPASSSSSSGSGGSGSPASSSGASSLDSLIDDAEKGTRSFSSGTERLHKHV